MDLTVADQRDVSGLAASQVFLKEYPLGIIDPRQPGQSVFRRFAHDGVDGAGRRAERILHHEGASLAPDQSFGLGTRGDEVRLREGDASLPAQFPGKIALAFEAQPLAGRAEDGDAQAQEFGRPGSQRPLERHRDQEVGSMLPETGAGVGHIDAGNARAFLTRPIMGVVPGEVGRYLCAVAP